MFNVKNTGTELAAFTFTRGCSANLNCTGQSLTEADLDWNQSVNVTVWFDAGAPGLGYVTLTAQGSGGEWGQGRWNVPVGHNVVVTPDAQTTSTRTVYTGGHSEIFTVQNIGGAQHTYSLSCSSSANVTCGSLSQTNVTLAGGAQTTVTANYTVTHFGLGTLAVTATGTGVIDVGSFAVPVNPAAGDPRIDTLPYNFATQDYTPCVSACFAATYVQSTPPYFSLDAPRSVTLAYNGDRVDPKPFVHVNVSPDLGFGETTTEYQLQVKVNDALVTFVNTDQTLRFTYGSGNKLRIGGQFNASSYATGVYPLDVFVTALYPVAGPKTTTWKAKLVVVNDTNSFIARGWTLAGIQRLYPQTDGSALVTEGGGSAIYFWKSGPNFVTPLGDFSQLVTGTPAGGSGWTRRYPDSTKVVFDAAGRMTEVRDRFNNVTTVIYDGSGKVSQIKDPLNLAITLGYGSNGLSTITDPGSPARITAVTVDGSKRLTAIWDPDSVSTSFGYDGSLRLQNITNRRGSATTFAYDANSGKLASITAPVITYVGENGADSTGSPVTTLVAWHKAGVPYTSTTTTPFTSVLADSVRARVTSPRGFTTSYAVNHFGAPTRVEAPLGRVSKIARNAHSQVTSDTAPNGHVVDYTWSGPNLTQTLDRTTGRTINIEYEPVYNEVRKVWGDTDSLWNYWSGGKLDSTRRGTSSRPVTKFTYDSRGRILSAVDRGTHAVTYYHNPGGFQNNDSVKTGTRRMAKTYDAYGRVATAKDPANSISSFLYDVLGRKIRLIGPLNDTTVFAYDSLYLRRITDAKGQVYQFTPNALGWVETRTDPRGKQESARYDRHGNVRRVVTRGADTITFTYDSLNQTRTRVAEGQTTAFFADPLGRFAATANGESIDTLKVDDAGRAEYEISVRSGTRYELRSTYNVRDLRTKLKIQAPWADSITYHYNVSMGLDTITSLGGGITAVSYNNEMQPTNVSFAAVAVSSSRVFPSTHTPSDITYNNPTINAAIGAKYGYTSVGLMADQFRVGAASDSGRDFSFDGLGRLTGYRDYTVQPTDCDWWDPEHYICLSSSKVVHYSETYTYDKVGNRTDLGAVADTGNRLIKFNGDSLFYDDDGNLVKRRRNGQDIQRLYWNSLGQLTAVWNIGADSVNFGYDGFGRRARKSTATATARYVHDGDDLFLEVDGAGNRVAEYTYYPGIDQPLSVRRGGAGGSVYYFVQDFPGNVRGLVTAGAALANQYRYKPFGTDDSGFPQGTVTNSVRFAARELDNETGMYYVRSRYYDPQTGRFISEDPIGLEGGINLYVYARNNPVNFVDPTGERCWTEAISFSVIGSFQASAQGDEKLVCDMRGGEDDISQIGNYLGGEAGRWARDFLSGWLVEGLGWAGSWDRASRRGAVGGGAGAVGLRLVGGQVRGARFIVPRGFRCEDVRQFIGWHGTYIPSIGGETYMAVGTLDVSPEGPERFGKRLYSGTLWALPITLGGPGPFIGKVQGEATCRTGVATFDEYTGPPLGIDWI